MKGKLMFFFLIGRAAIAQTDSIEPKNYASVQFGIQSADIDRPTIGVNFARTLYPKLSLRIGLLVNSFEDNELMLDSLIFEDEEIQIFRNQYQFQKSMTVKVGGEYKLNKYLHGGLDLLMGYSRNHISFEDRSKSMNNTGEWVWDSNAILETYPSLFEVKEKDNGSTPPFRGLYNAYLNYANYLITGASVNLALILPIKKMLDIGLIFSANYSQYTHLNNNELITDLSAYSEVYPTFGTLVTDLPSFNLFNQLLMAEIRVKF